MGGSNGVGGIGSQQVQQVQINSTSPEAASPKVGHLGSHTVKVASPSAGEKANLVQSKDQLAASLGGRESAVDSFLKKTEILRDYINTKMSGLGRSGETLSLKSDLSAAINSRAGEWIDSISALMDEGASVEEINRASDDLVGELKDLVDKSLAESPKAATAEKPEVSSAEPKNVAAEKLVEADSKYSSRAAKALNAPVEKTHVYENLGGGSCFFHSILQLLAKSDPSRYPAVDQRGAASRLRQKLIDHVHEMKDRVMKSDKLPGMEATIEDGKITCVSVRTRDGKGSVEMKPITEGFDLALDEEFKEYKTLADVSTAALMADYLQRPIVVVAQDWKGDVTVQEFNHGIESGQKLEGEPLTIYYDYGAAHFMAVSVDA